jgi:hypothetical protein
MNGLDALARWDYCYFYAYRYTYFGLAWYAPPVYPRGLAALCQYMPAR